jgi:aspartate racemase
MNSIILIISQHLAVAAFLNVLDLSRGDSSKEKLLWDFAVAVHIMKGSHMHNRIGILGGMGPDATLHFQQLLLAALSEAFKPECDQDYPDITIQMENSTPDRTEAIKNDNPEAATRINKAIAGLILMGCDPIVIPCITAHALVERRWFEAGVIDFRRCITDNSDTDYPERLAVLATDGGIISEVFSPLLNNFNLIFPAKTKQKQLMSVIYGSQGLKSCSADDQLCKARLIDVIDDLRNQGAQRFLAGCTEIETFVSREGIDDGFILPMALMCEEVVERVQSGVVGR